MIVRFKMFESTFKSWNTLFEEAAAFANTLERERLITISHSADNSTGVVVVWYWAEAQPVSVPLAKEPTRGTDADEGGFRIDGV